ncbi:MAG: arginine--tRNA ligase [Anaerolineales bacterium]|nr:arginine--tRNA ligase [Anaerolineales bacterium]
MFDPERLAIENRIHQFCAQHRLPNLAAWNWSPIPFSGDWGISTSFFQLAALEARLTRENGLPAPALPVPQRAQEIASQVAQFLGVPEGFARVEAVKGYLNLYFDPAAYAQRVIQTVLQEGANFGRGAPKDERVMVEYAQPNTHHSFHIGHYRNTILGEALARQVEFAGFPTIRASYPGDIGLGVITILWAYQKFYRGQEPQGVHERGQWLLKLYVEATRLLEPQPDETPEQTAQREAYEAERRELYRKWDAHDPEARQLWLETRQWSMEELYDILEMMDVHIDVWFFESEVDEPAKQIAEELVRLGIADDERPQGGAVIVRIDEKLGLKKEKYRTNVILRSDGTTLYLTKDLALAKVKFEQYHVERSIYVVDVRQSLHLQQAFKILELWGFKQAEKCYHLGYGFVSLPEGAMSARRGRVVLFKDVADEAQRRVLSEIAQKNPDLPQEQRQQVALQVGLGALAYAMLAVDNNKDTVFDIEAALNFDGRTGSYIQNAHVRACSILRKAGEPVPQNATFDHPLTSHEMQLIDLISRFPAVVEQAASEYRPLVMASYAYDLANAFHSFYQAVPVLQAETPAIRQARLAIVATARQVLANALHLLAIAAPQIM